MKTVSPFEWAIMSIADPEKAKQYRPETNKEKEDRLTYKAKAFAKSIKIKK